MRKFFFLVLSLFLSVSANAQTELNYECVGVRPTMNMKALTLKIIFDENDIENAKIIITYTKYDGYIKNLILNSIEGSNTNLGDSITFEMDKDPYAGGVGTFYWSYKIPNEYFSTETNDDLPNVSYKWEGTPSGPGNNTGLGFQPSWICKAINN